jgi:DNA-binding sugar fermentation-stimulating protein
MTVKKSKQHVKPTLVQKSSRIKIYNAPALRILLYGSEIWTLRQKDKNRLTSTEMNFSRRRAGYTLLDHKRNEEILEELRVERGDEKLRSYKPNCLKHATRMNSNRMPKTMLNY